MECGDYPASKAWRFGREGIFSGAGEFFQLRLKLLAVRGDEIDITLQQSALKSLLKVFACRAFQLRGLVRSLFGLHLLRWILAR